MCSRLSFHQEIRRKIGKEDFSHAAKGDEDAASLPLSREYKRAENIIERAIILARDETLQLDESLELLKSSAAPAENEGTLAEVERSHIVSVLQKTNWRIEGQQGAALRLGINPNTLRSRMQKLGIKRPAAGAISEL